MEATHNCQQTLYIPMDNELNSSNLYCNTAPNQTITHILTAVDILSLLKWYILPMDLENIEKHYDEALIVTDSLIHWRCHWISKYFHISSAHRSFSWSINIFQKKQATHISNHYQWWKIIHDIACINCNSHPYHMTPEIMIHAKNSKVTSLSQPNNVFPLSQSWYLPISYSHIHHSVSIKITVKTVVTSFQITITKFTVIKTQWTTYKETTTHTTTIT